MKLLYYNWVDYLDDEGRGGGVSVYQRNLMRAFADRPGVEAAFLSSGISYDLLRPKPRWEQVRHGPKTDQSRRFEIVNSGVLAPAHHAFGSTAQLSHVATRDAVFDFIDQTGPYDVIHFNNLEGLPADVLTLKERWPQTRVVLSLHNYYPICPQVNLWHQEQAACTDFAGGANCADCLMHQPDMRLVRLANGLAYHLKCAGIRPGTRRFDLTFRQAMRVGHYSSRALGWARRRLRGGTRIPAQAPAADAFAARRDGMIDQINRQCDLVLCVSDRVRAIAQSYGIEPKLSRTSYIGTQAADLFATSRPTAQKQSLTMAFLGYMRADKGFFFLLDALEALPDDIAARLKLVVAARRGPVEAMARLDALSTRLEGLSYYDGYSHDQLDTLLDGVDLGVVPVLWEDCLPQVAIEMFARHVPLLTSDMGGAQELGQSDDLVFAAGDVTDFADRLRAVLAGEVDFDRYWRQARPPQVMSAHLEELLGLYAGASAPATAAAH